MASKRLHPAVFATIPVAVLLAFQVIALVTGAWQVSSIVFFALIDTAVWLVLALVWTSTKPATK